MAGAVTLLGSGTFTTTSGTKTVTATPAVGDLIVIVTAHSGNTSATAPTDNNSSGTYTLIGTAVKATSVDTMKFWVRDALIGAASSTVFTHAPGASTGGGLVVLKVTGMTRVGSAAFRQFAKQDNQAAATPAPVFASAALTTNPVIGAVFNANTPAGLTPRGTPAYTERFDNGYGTPTTGLEVMSINTGETGTTITWGGASASAFGSAVVELDASVAIATGLATETDTASALGKVKQRAVGLATETETASALGRVKSKPVGLATETNMAYALEVGSTTPPVEEGDAGWIARARRRRRR